MGRDIDEDCGTMNAEHVVGTVKRVASMPTMAAVVMAILRVDIIIVINVMDEDISSGGWGVDGECGMKWTRNTQPTVCACDLPLL